MLLLGWMKRSQIDSAPIHKKETLQNLETGSVTFLFTIHFAYSGKWYVAFLSSSTVTLPLLITNRRSGMSMTASW